MEYEKPIPFKNWTSTDFKGLYGGIFYDFRAGSTYSVPASQAKHFAKQLAVRELHTTGYYGNMVRGEMLSDQDVKEFSDKCFPSTKPDDEGVTSGTFDVIEDSPEDVPAKEAIGVKDANTAKPREIPDNEENADDEKNNAGTPKFKSNPKSLKTKDAEYQ